ncbi:glycosyltransferase [bacterium]|nr:glycosyltransferase [bacterium]MBU1074236.1 glycosyltransferase [bacterium]MBU1674781.1 glycosyltransferase [bacterium]
MSMRLSVVVPTHDKLSQLKRSLAALAAQTLPAAEWELLVVDDGSGDGTAAWLETASESWSGRLRVVSPGRNLGRAAARNLGGGEAAGEWILFLDDDIVAPPTLLASHVDLLANHPGCGVIGLVRTAREVIDGPHFHYIDSRGVAKVSGELVPARYLVTQNTSFPRAAFVAVGGFDVRFSAYGFEDMELGFRLEDEQGIRFLPLREPVPEHIHHHGLGAWLAKKRECGHGPLQLLAELHPSRLPEMKLDLVMDVSGGGRAPWHVRVARTLALGPVRTLFESVARNWPTAKSYAPVLFPLYAKLLDVLVLAAYCQGLSEFGRTDGKD